MDDLIDRLEQLIREHVLGAMPADPSGGLAGMRLADLLIEYGTWHSRFVPSRPRKAHVSEELGASPKRTEHKAALDPLVAKIESGADLTPHLSKRIKVAHEAGATKLSGRKDRDLLIADWGIHHLHLSTEMEAGGEFVKRTGDLLFAAFATDDAYLINIYSHGSWALKDVVATLVRNWPDSGILRPIAGVVGLTQEPTDDERLQLRNAGVAQALEIDGKVYFPPGQTIAGTPIAATRHAHALMWTFDDWRENGKEHLAEFARQIDEAAGRQVTNQWQPAIHEDMCGFLRDRFFVPVAALS